MLSVSLPTNQMPRVILPIVKERHIEKIVSRLRKRVDLFPYECYDDLEANITLSGGYDIEVWGKYYVETIGGRGGSYENEFESITHITYSNFTITECICRDRRGDIVDCPIDSSLIEQILNQ